MFYITDSKDPDQFAHMAQTDSGIIVLSIFQGPKVVIKQKQHMYVQADLDFGSFHFHLVLIAIQFLLKYISYYVL